MLIGTVEESFYSSSLTMVIDLNKRVRFSFHYPSFCGRNMYELLRVIDSLQMFVVKKTVTPSNWQEGQDVFLSDDVEESIQQTIFPKGVVSLRPWFRITPQPDL